MNKNILILGASSDLGLELIRSLATKDNFIFATFKTDSKRLDEVCKEYPGKIVKFKCDLSNQEELTGLMSEVTSTLGCPDGFINLAAPPLVLSKYHKTSWELFQNDLDVQLKSTHILLSQLLPKMFNRGSGKIVFMLSSATLNVPPAGMVEYTTVKYAMLGLMKALASEYKTAGININAVSPSMLETKFLANLHPSTVEASGAGHPKKRLGAPKDVIGTIEFLLSDEADFIHGVNLPVTGGESF